MLEYAKLGSLLKIQTKANERTAVKIIMHMISVSSVMQDDILGQIYSDIIVVVSKKEFMIAQLSKLVSICQEIAHLIKVK